MLERPQDAEADPAIYLLEARPAVAIFPGSEYCDVLGESSAKTQHLGRHLSCMGGKDPDSSR